MPEPITARVTHREYSFETDDDPVCRADLDAAATLGVTAEADLTCREQAAKAAGDPWKHGDPARGGVQDRPHEVPDYVTLAGGLGAIIGAGVSLTIDRYGETYVGVASGVGMSPKTAGVGVAAGRLAGSAAAGASPSEVRAFLEGDSVSASAGLGASVGIVNGAAGTATEIGLGTPQVGAQFQHNWHLWHAPVHW